MVVTILIGLSFDAAADFFESKVHEVHENEREITIPILRQGDLGNATLVLETIQHNAYPDVHFKATSQQIDFNQGQENSEIKIRLIDNSNVDGSKVFYVKAIDNASLEEDTAKIIIHDNEQPLHLDRSFQPNFKLSRILNELPDGKLLALTNQGLIRIEPDGKLDPDFHFEFDPEPSAESYQYISHAIPLPDGNILVGGGLERFGPQAPTFRSILWKADANGTRDNEFRVSNTAISFLDEVLLLPDNSILMVGVYENFNTGFYFSRMRKYSLDGKSDSTFVGTSLFRNEGEHVSDVELWDDENVLVAGHFSKIGAHFIQSVAMMDLQGNVNPDFSLDLPHGANIRRVKRLSDGTILIAGRWDSEDGDTKNHIARYHLDGTIVRSFQPYDTDFDGLVNSMAIDINEEYAYVTGNFSHYQDTPVGNLVRLNLSHGGADPRWTHVGRDHNGYGGLFISQSGSIFSGSERLFTDTQSRVGIQFSESSNQTWTEGDEEVIVKIERLGPSHEPITIQLDYSDSHGDLSEALLNAPTQVKIDKLQTHHEWKLKIKNDPKVNGNRLLPINAQLVTNTQDGYENSDAKIALIDKEIPNQVDRTFGNDPEDPYFYRSINDAILLQDHSFLLTNQNGLEGVIKISSNGKRDPNFSVSTDFYDQMSITTLLQQPDGKILLGGYGYHRSGSQRPVIIRVDPDSGKLDPNFVLNQFSPANNYGGVISAITLQPTSEGLKILIGGSVRTTAGRGLARLNLDGTIDTTFSIGYGFDDIYDSLQINVISVLPDDQGLLIGGRFARVNRIPRNSLAMLTKNGEFIEEFRPNLGHIIKVADIELTKEGDVLLAGNFPDQNSHIIKLDLSGNLKNNFKAPSFNQEISDIVSMNNGNVLVSGRFSKLDGLPRNGIARLMPDGSNDRSLITGSNRGSNVEQMVLLDQDTLYLFGGMSSWDLVPVNGTVKINLESDPNRPGFTLGSSHRTIYLRESSDVDTSTATIYRLGASDQQIDVPFDVQDVTGTTGSDIHIHSDSIVIEPGQESQSLEVSAIDDGILETQEWVEIGFNPVPGTPVSEILAVSIYDNELPSVIDSDFKHIGFQSGSIHELFKLSNGKIAIAGSMTLAGQNSGPSVGLVIANPDGSIDESFSWDARLSSNVYAVAETEEGLLLGGAFQGQINDADGKSHLVSGLVHVSLEGEILDLELGSIRGGRVHTIERDDTGRYLIGGSFTTIRGYRYSNIARLNSDTTVDTTFTTTTRPNQTVQQIIQSEDGHILIGGNFDQVNRIATGPLARLHEDGTFDESFQPTLYGYLDHMWVLSNQKILVEGNLSITPNTETVSMLLLHPDGTVDSSFSAPQDIRNINRIWELSSGELMVAGNYDHVNGESSVGIVKLSPSGDPIPTSIWPASFGTADITIRDVIPFENESFLIAGNFSGLGAVPNFGLVKLNFNSPEQTTVFLDQRSISIQEGIAESSFLIKRTGDIQNESLVTFSLTPKTATENVDYNAITQTVTLAPLELETTVPISAIEDDFPEMDETFLIQLEQTDANSVLGNSIQEVFIRDNDRVGSLDDSFIPTIQKIFTYYSGGRGWIFDDYGYDNAGYIGDYSTSISSPYDNPNDYEQFTEIVDGEVSQLIVQQNQSIIIQGDFNLINGIPTANLARLFPDGTLDESFKLDTTETYQFESIFSQADGGIIWKGYLSDLNGIYRLQSNGTIDSSFQSYHSGPNSNLEPLQLYDDGRILVRESHYDERGNYSMALHRLGKDGDIDASFDTKISISGYVTSAAILPDESILIGGDFTRFGNRRVRHLARLLPNGEIDEHFPTFDPPNRRVSEMTTLKDGSVMIYGNFDQIAGIEIFNPINPPIFYSDPGIARILFPSEKVIPLHNFYNSSMNFSAIDSQRGGRLLIPGSHTWGSHASLGLQIWDLNTGLPDQRFDFGLGLKGYVGDAAFARNGDFYMAGDLSEFNGAQVGSLIRINGEPVTVIEAIQLDEHGNFTISVQSTPQITYVLESTTDMVTWQVEATSMADHDKLSMSVPMQDTHRYFRVVRMPK